MVVVRRFTIFFSLKIFRFLTAIHQNYNKYDFKVNFHWRIIFTCLWCKVGNRMNAKILLKLHGPLGSCDFKEFWAFIRLLLYYMTGKITKARAFNCTAVQIENQRWILACSQPITIQWFSEWYRRIHADVIVYIFTHLHTALRTEGNMLDMNWLQASKEIVKLSTWWNL